MPPRGVTICVVSDQGLTRNILQCSLSCSLSAAIYLFKYHYVLTFSQVLWIVVGFNIITSLSQLLRTVQCLPLTGMTALTSVVCCPGFNCTRYDYVLTSVVCCPGITPIGYHCVFTVVVCCPKFTSVRYHNVLISMVLSDMTVFSRLLYTLSRTYLRQVPLYSHSSLHILRVLWTVQGVPLSSMLSECWEMSRVYLCQVCFQSVVHCPGGTFVRYVLRVLRNVQGVNLSSMLSECWEMSRVYLCQVCSQSVEKCPGCTSVRYAFRVLWIVQGVPLSGMFLECCELSRVPLSGMSAECCVLFGVYLRRVPLYAHGCCGLFVVYLNPVKLCPPSCFWVLSTVEPLLGITKFSQLLCNQASQCSHKCCVLSWIYLQQVSLCSHCCCVTRYHSFLPPVVSFPGFTSARYHYLFTIVVYGPNLLPSCIAVLRSAVYCPGPTSVRYHCVLRSAVHCPGPTSVKYHCVLRSAVHCPGPTSVRYHDVLRSAPYCPGPVSYTHLTLPTTAEV